MPRKGLKNDVFCLFDSFKMINFFYIFYINIHNKDFFYLFIFTDININFY